VGTPQDGVSMISCAPARGATSYEFQGSTDGGVTWSPLGSSVAPSISANLGAGTWQIRARGIGTLAGPWAVWTGAVADVTYPPAAPTLTLQNPPFMGGAMHVNISNANGDFRHVQVLTGGVVRVEYDTTNYVADWDLATAQANNAVSPSVTFNVTETNAVGTSSVASLTVTKPAPPAPTGSYSSNGDGTGTVTINAVSAQDLNQYIIRSGSASGPILYQKSSPGSVSVSSGSSFFLSVTDQWGNTSATTEVDAPSGGL